MIRDITHSPRMASTSVVPLPDEAYFRIPSSPVIKLIYEMFTAGRHLARLADGKAEVNRKVSLEAYERDGRTELHYMNDSDGFTLSVATDLLPDLKAGRLIKKTFLFLLMKWNRQQEFQAITIPLKEFVENNAYSTEINARRGIKAAMPALLSLKIQGRQIHGRKKYFSIPDETPLFDDWRIAKGKLQVIPNRDCNTEFMFEYFTSLPKFFFKLSSNAQDVAFHIFFMARQAQNVDRLYKGQSFTVSFPALRAALCLPAIGETEHPKRDCTDKLLEAIEDINSTAAGTGLVLTIRGDLNATASECLETGKVEVSITGGLLESLQTIMARRDKAAKREQRIRAMKEKALAEKIRKAAEE